MKKLIVYSSKTGTTEKCAGILGQNLIDAIVLNSLRCGRKKECII